MSKKKMLVVFLIFFIALPAAVFASYSDETTISNEMEPSPWDDMSEYAPVEDLDEAGETTGEWGYGEENIQEESGEQVSETILY